MAHRPGRQLPRSVLRPAGHEKTFPPDRQHASSRSLARADSPSPTAISRPRVSFRSWTSPRRRATASTTTSAPPRGLDYYWAKQAVLNSSLAELQGSGSGLGWNLGLMFRKDALSLGASYHSAATVSDRRDLYPAEPDPGHAQTAGPGPDGRAGPEPPLAPATGRAATPSTHSSPSRWTGPAWAGASSRGSRSRARTAACSIFSDTNDWEDADAIRLGLTYDIRPTTQLRFGYSYDETAQPDAHFSARVPDMDRQLFSIGVAQGFGQGLTVEAGYMYVLTEDRNYVGDSQYGGSERHQRHHGHRRRLQGRHQPLRHRGQQVVLEGDRARDGRSPWQEGRTKTKAAQSGGLCLCLPGSDWARGEAGADDQI